MMTVRDKNEVGRKGSPSSTPEVNAEEKERSLESTLDWLVEKDSKSLEEINSKPDAQMIGVNKDDGEKPKASESKDNNEDRWPEVRKTMSRCSPGDKRMTTTTAHP